MSARIASRRFIVTNTSKSPSINFFKVLDMPQSFNIDHTFLKASYKSLIVANHPDRFASSSHSAPLDAALITTAFQTLSTPNLRAEHLLQLAGEALDEESSTQNPLPMEFLMEIMEIRETLSEIDRDDPTAVDQLNQLKQANEERVLEVVAEANVAFDGDGDGDSDGDGDGDSDKINMVEERRRCSAFLNYFRRIEEEIKEKEMVT